MGAFGFWPWRGMLVIKVVGPRPERLVNMAVKAGLALYELERPSANMLVAKVGILAFRRLRALARQGAWKITILKRLGLPFAMRKLWRRKALVLGGIAALAAVYISSSFVWFVSVQGAGEVAPARILAAARQAGLSAGIAKRAFSPQVVEKQLLLALPDLTWVNVDVKGTLATIHVAERIVPDSDLTNPGDVVAAADGVVEKLVTLRGIPMVQEGDVVAAGQLLISGLIPPRAPEHKELVEKGGVPYVRADGITLARVWREGYAEAVLLQREKVPTGRVSRQLLWQWGGRSGYLGRGADFPVYQEQTRIWQPRLAGWRLPAAIGLLERAEVEVQQRPLDPDEARESALAAAWEQVKAAMPPGAEINSPPQVEMETALEGSTPVVRVRVTVEALEDIRLFRPLAPDSAPAASRALSIQPVPGP